VGEYGFYLQQARREIPEDSGSGGDLKAGVVGKGGSEIGREKLSGDTRRDPMFTAGLNCYFKAEPLE